MSDLDSLAGAIAYRHCLPTPSPSAELDDITTFHEAPARARLYLATASADRLDMFGSLNRDLVRSVFPLFHHSCHTDLRRDLRFSGFVTWTGNSSMEVVVKMSGSTGEGWETLMLGRFAMVCRDSRTHRARKVPSLIVETEEERVLWDIGEGELS